MKIANMEITRKHILHAIIIRNHPLFLKSVSLAFGVFLVSPDWEFLINVLYASEKIQLILCL
jgi:hypothetical protein